jgi:hypothetical protein
VEIPIAEFSLPRKYPGFQKYPVRVFRSNRFCVQVFEEAEGMMRLSINRAAIDRNGQWLDGITWEELQELKSQAGFGDYDAVEVFPADADVVCIANMRHLFIFKTPLQRADPSL